ncbi:MAG: xanthine phosphoribosyltransferase, partial [Muribaculaceae bacterium]|nr:xanthine phosphoribosyltransferase [Muribaculaceae bacterium]
EVESFTHGNTNTVVLSKEYLNSDDRVLIVDDFLATGAALVGLAEIVRQAGAELVGVGIAVEKAFQGGGDMLRAKGMRIESLARIASMSDDSLSFVKD